jgi:DNA-damage-inducible protein D
MKRELIAELFERFENGCYLFNGLECWSARELQEILGYSKWDNFVKVIDKAKTSCQNAGELISNHFADIGKMVQIGSGTEREIADIALTRYACYLVAQSGDTAKNEVAFAQTYFAVQTRKQEIIEKRLLDLARVAAREKLSKSERNFRGLYMKGVLMIKVLR